ncbi:MAG: ABC transporter substrate-binding protein [Chitinophagaceae bacterium]
MQQNLIRPIRLTGRLLVLALLFVSFANKTYAQKHRIAIFAPLYLDSAFDGTNTYRYTKNTFPKFINPGLEFYEGAQLAIDSLNAEGDELEVFIYDTRSATEDLQQILAKPVIAEMDLVIAHCSGNEVRSFAEFGLRNSIPVINATVPNDAGTTSNPFFVLLNPTLKTQCEGIYQYVQKYFSKSPVIVFRRKGSADDLVKNLLEEYSSSTTEVPLKFRFVELPDSFSVYQLKAQLDSNKKSLCIAGSLDMNFGKRLSAQLASISKQYPLAIMGMPTWDGIREFSRPEFKGPEIIYSTPFYNSKTDRVSQSITNYFNTFMYSRPSDMVFRGYEVTWKYAKLLTRYKQDIASNLGNKEFRVFTDYDVQPVINKRTSNLDYFENKKLYFLKWQDGLIKSVN